MRGTRGVRPATPERGVTGRYRQGQTNHCAGNRWLLEERGIAIDPGLDARARSRAAEAHSIVWFADERRALAVAAVSDRLRKGSREAVAELRRRGIEVHMLTGDQEASAAAVARAAGITRVKAGVLPSEKEAYIRDLQRGGHVVAMAGDGINDSAALARADVGIALGNGSDIALEAARVAILSSDLTRIPEAIRLSARPSTHHAAACSGLSILCRSISVPSGRGALAPALQLPRSSMSSGSHGRGRVDAGDEQPYGLKLTGPGLRHEETDISKPYTDMKKEYKVEGMMCNHCRMHVEKAFDAAEGVNATVTLTPPVAVIEFSGDAKPFGACKPYWPKIKFSEM